MPPPSPRLLGYCTNVHAGETFDETCHNLERFAVPVKRLVSPDEPLGIGLWLSARAAAEVRASDGARAFGEWLDERGLDVFTINGFPAGDFHRTIVKHAVYEPTWRDPARLAYTVDLLHILAALRAPRGAGAEGSISTVPLGWGGTIRRDVDLRASADALLRAVDVARRIEGEWGVRLHVDLEPEPGCALQTSADVVEFFREFLPARDEIRRYLRVCHDVCHAAVMFEDQAEVLAAYDAEGVAVGKVQVSSAVVAPFASLDPLERRAAWRQLEGFREPRYLHQTTRLAGGVAPILSEDLPLAMAAQGRFEPPDDEWRIHFHVPIFVDVFGRLRTTQREITRALDLFATRPEVRHFEIETYAWDVLPPELHEADLPRGIAREFTWLREHAPQGFFS